MTDRKNEGGHEDERVSERGRGLRVVPPPRPERTPPPAGDDIRELLEGLRRPPGEETPPDDLPPAA